MMKKIKEVEQWGPIDSVILYQSFWYLPISSGAFEAWGARWPRILGIFEDCRVTFVWEKQEAIDNGIPVIERTLLVPTQKKKLWDAQRKIDRNLKNQARLIEKTIKADEKNGQSISELAIEWIRLLYIAWQIGVTPEIANFAAPAYLGEKLRALMPEEAIPQALETLLSPEQSSFHQQSDKELFELGTEFGTNIPTEKIKAYADKWSWVENSYMGSKNLTETYFLGKLSGLSKSDCANKVAEINEYLRYIKERKRELVKTYALPEAIEHLADELSFSIWWQDHRKGLAWWSHITTDVLAHWAENHLDVTFENQLMYMTEEWDNLFKRKEKVSHEILDERKKVFVIDIMPDKGVREIYGKEAAQLRDTYITKDIGKVENELKGTPVSRGSTTGRVHVMHSSREAGKMQKGKVLVAPMTSPDFIVAMRKASAVITDVGGLMSHAAIVSRELGIPCIVGTKIATKVLKDGDVVEVDANAGTVKIMKRADEGQK